ncbi:hypothetical protein BDZ88DRAFT_411859 [Geranomyces variabilis]|nr:hypothetical protein BDZ88DRAFT_411859 [Geranomyces variabilis]KAJ3133852.1 hypothetical protein HDU90_005460 [Geranomyces variabilis]
MPPAHRRCTSDLAIYVDAPHGHRPGSTIHGKVVRVAQLVAHQTQVSIILHGRAKSKIEETAENGSTFRTEFMLLNPIRHILHDGSIAMSNAPPSEWAFAITLPERPHHAALMRGGDKAKVLTPGGDKAKASFLKLSPDAVAQHESPPTFRFDSNGCGLFKNYSEAYVEYWLEAELRTDCRVKGSSVYTAKLPVTVLAPPPPSPVWDLGMQVLSRVRGQGIPVIFKSNAFLEAQVPKSGFKLGKLFHLTPTPQLHVTAMINVPTVIQLEHPMPVPIIMRLYVCREYTHESLGGNPPPVTLESVRLRIKSTTEVQTEGGWVTKIHTESGSHTTQLDVTRLQPNMQIVIPYAREELNLADVVPFTLRARDILALTTPPAAHRFAPSDVETVYPDFTTYNIRHTHRAVWTFVLAAGGKEVELVREMPLKIVSSSEPASDAPPPRDGALESESSRVGGGAESELPVYAPAAEEEAVPPYTARPSQIVNA